MTFEATEVAPKLWIGSYPGDGSEMFAAARMAGFHRVIRVAAGLPHEYPLEDVALTPKQAGLALKAAAEVARELFAGKRVLVTCMAGINRSAFVAGLAMTIRWKCTGAEAIKRIRANRKPPDGSMALRNHTFANFLATYA